MPQSWTILTSLGLHGLLLAVPLEFQGTAVDRPERPPIQISRLPPRSTPAASPKPTPKPTPKPSASAAKSAIAPRFSQFPPFQESTPETTSETAIAAESPTNSTLAETAPSQTEKSTPPTVPVPFEDFPRYPQARSGSCGLLTGELNLSSQQTDDDLATVAAYFQQALPTKGYKILAQPNPQTYPVAKGGLAKVLNLLPCGDRGTAIILSDQPLDPRQLQTLQQTSPIQAKFDQALALKQYGDRVSVRSDTVAISPELFFAQPELFFKDGNPLPGMNANVIQVEGIPPDRLLAEALTPNFDRAGFRFQMLPNYGGGALVKVQQTNFSRYLSLLALPGGTGTIVVIWETRPIP